MNDGMINTATGRKPLDRTGYILPHEHIASTLQVLETASVKLIIEHYVPLYRRLAQQYGCRTVVELSPRLVAAEFGDKWRTDGNRRDSLEIYAEVSRESGVDVVLCTGFYREFSRPPYFYERSTAELADEMIRDISEGIDGSGVKAGIIKIALDSMDAAQNRKLLAAAAIAQKATGVAVSTHTCSDEVRFGTLNYLEGAGVDPSRIYLGHADSNSDIGEALALARRGCNLILTIWGITDEASIGWHHGQLPKSLSSYMARALLDEGYLGQLLVSVDYGASVKDGKLAPMLYGIDTRDSTFAFTYTVPLLKRMGFTQEQIDTVMKENPAKMLLADKR